MRSAAFSILARQTVSWCFARRSAWLTSSRAFADKGIPVQAIHGDVTQSGRERALKACRQGRADVLIATDVAARGLDVPDVSLVVNFDIPPDPEFYVHRIGRTGRSGKAGEAITFVNPREMRELKVIERVTGARIRRGEAPTPREIEERGTKKLRASSATPWRVLHGDVTSRSWRASHPNGMLWRSRPQLSPSQVHPPA